MRAQGDRPLILSALLAGTFLTESVKSPRKSRSPALSEDATHYGLAFIVAFQIEGPSRVPMQGPLESYPRTAYLLSLIGGILILVFSVIYALAILVVASINATVGFGLGVGHRIALAVVAILFGLIVLYFALKLKSSPQNAKTYGILILVFSVISFIGGGGFYIGASLALVGGILAIVWRPSVVQTYGQPMAAPGWGAQPPPPPSMPPVAGGGAQFCQFCGTAVPAGAKFCPKCGAGVPGG